MPATPTARPHDTRFVDVDSRAREPDAGARVGGRAWIDLAIVLAAYVLLLLITRTSDQGDSNIYADDLVLWLRGLTTGTKWEFGHAYWRPLHYALFRLYQDGDGVTDGVLFSQAIRQITTVVMLFGALAVVTFRSWLGRVCSSRTASTAASVAFAAAAAFIGYAQTASSYIPALAMLLIGLRELAADEEQRDMVTIVVASFAFAFAVLLWFPMVLAVPGAAISMLLLRGNDARRRRIAIAVCLLSGAITVIGYVPIAYLAQVHSVADFRTWMGKATHDIRGIGGLSRAVIGFGRSLVNMDRLGLVAKRHLIGDVYNPASWGDVARAGLLRLGVLYVLLGTMTLWLARRASGRRVLAFVVATAIPVVGFALKWQGGDLERYLALFPALFLAVAAFIATLPARAQLASGIGVALLFTAVNVPAIARSKSERECAVLTARLESVPRIGGDVAVLLTPHELDEIATFKGRCPHSPLLGSVNPPQAFGLVMANNEKASEWRAGLAKRSGEVWQQGGHVWISRRAFVEKPPATWRWAEGDDPRLHWRDFPSYFKQLDVGPPMGGEDGWMEVLPTLRTREAMERLRRMPPG
ncbi:MAG: hypothetical protein ABIP93_14045 [Gemmatimonadaceae bacterium]